MKYKLENENFMENYLENLLQERGVEDIEQFFNLTQDLLNDSKDLDFIEKGKLLIDQALDSNKKVMLIVDSDCDGFTSAAIIYLYLKKLKPELEIEYRLHEGKQHGLEDQVDYLMETENLYSLIIVPDASTNEYEQHEQLKEKGYPVLVLDHHIFDGETFSKNAVIINNQLAPNYRNKDLTGAGVVFQFCRYLDQCYGVDYSNEFYDLAALGLIGDMASVLTLENRYIIVRGLQNVKNPFFIELAEKQSFSTKGKLNPMTIAFYLVPLINALIRVGTMEEKIIMFEGFINGYGVMPSGKRGSQGEDTLIAREAVRIATNAHSRQARIRDKAVEKIETKIYKEGLLDNKILFVRLDEEDDFPPELNGLVAMILAKKFGKPTLIGRLGEDGYIKGSIRGLDNSEISSLKDFLKDTEMFEYISGHDNAAGHKIKNDNLSNFHDIANEKLKDIDLGEGVYGVNFLRQAASPDLYQLVMDLGQAEDIWGQKNPTPLIYVDGIVLDRSSISIIGSKKDTVRFTINGVIFIAFRATKMIEELEGLETIEMKIIGKPNLNEWGNRITPQLFIEDYELSDGRLAF